AVEFDAEVDDFLLAAFEIELLAVERHLHLLGAVAGFGELRFELLDVRFTGSHLLGAALEAVAQVREALVDSVQLPQCGSRDAHVRPPWCERTSRMMAMIFI